MNYLISKLYTKLGEKRSTSRAKTVSEVEIQEIEDQVGDEPMCYYLVPCIRAYLFVTYEAPHKFRKF